MTATTRTAGEPLVLHEDRYFDPDPAVRRLARRLYDEVRALPLVSPHGHVEARVLADDAPFPEPTALLVTPDHYLLRMLYSQGVPLETLGIAPRGGGAGDPPVEADPRAADDDLRHHRALRASGWAGGERVVPTFRPDALFRVAAPGWAPALAGLEASVRRPLPDHAAFVGALAERRAYFRSLGATATDHAVLEPYTARLPEADVEALFQRARRGDATPADQRAFEAHMLMATRAAVVVPRLAGGDAALPRPGHRDGGDLQHDGLRGRHAGVLFHPGAARPGARVGGGAGA